MPVDVASPGEHAEKCVDDLSREGNTHLDSQRLEQRQEEGQHLIGDIWETQVTVNIVSPEDIFINHISYQETEEMVTQLVCTSPYWGSLYLPVFL